MAVSDPTRADALQIENSDALPGPRLIEARVEDGSLFFTDPRVPAGIPLFELAGLQRAHNTIVVSQTGEAASKDEDLNPVTTIQKALDLVPDSSDENNPFHIVLMPGVYLENPLWVKDFVTVTGFGPVTIRSPVDQDTLRVVQGVSTTPRRVTLQNVRVENSFPGRSCVRVLSSQFSTSTLTFMMIPNVGDFVTIAGVQFQAIPVGDVPGPNQFPLGVTTEETISNLSDAIENPLNGISTTVVPSSALNVLTLRAFQPGVGGNVLTLTSSVPLIMVPSGPTFSGGQDTSPGSLVGVFGIDLKNCDLVATGLNGYNLRAQAVNSIRVVGGDWTDSGVPTSFVEVREVASLQVSGVTISRLEAHYDTSLVRPSVLTSEYSFKDVHLLSQTYSSLVGEGSFSARDCVFENVSVSGDRTFTFWDSSLEDTNVGLTSSLVLKESTRRILTGDPTATVSETEALVSLSFNASLSETFSFPVPAPDDLYTVLLETGSLNFPFVSGKTATDFTVDFGVPFTGVVNAVVKRS